MALDLQSLKQLDPQEIPWWPHPWRTIVLVIAAILVFALGSYFLLLEDWQKYQQDVAEERKLKQEYQLKFHRTANLPVYRQQLETLNAALTDLLAMLPTDDETPRLLDDITLMATQNGLKIARIEWLDPVQRDLYTALPMDIELVGEYHQVGNFIADVAGLDRIISIQNFTLIKRGGDPNDASLRFGVRAETYRQQTMRKAP